MYTFKDFGCTAPLSLYKSLLKLLKAKFTIRGPPDVLSVGRGYVKFPALAVLNAPDGLDTSACH